MPSLAEILKAEADIVSAFVLLLKEEQEILKDGRAEALPGVLERKTEAVRKLNPVSTTRNLELARNGLPADRPGMDAWLEKNPAAKDVRQSWEKLQGLAAEAQELNRVNGELIRMRMQNNSQALEALLSAANAVQLYGADGQTSSATGRRIIDSA